MKKIIRLTESDLVKLVKKVIKEQVNSEQPDFRGKIPRGSHTIVRDPRLGPNKGRVVPNATNPITGISKYTPESQENDVQIGIGKMTIFPTDRCVAQNLVTNMIGKGIVDDTDRVTKTLKDVYGKDIKNAVYYVWDGRGEFKVTGYEGVHLVNVCPGRGPKGNNLGLTPYIQGMPITGVSTEYKNVGY
jgi:hypothetical protein